MPPISIPARRSAHVRLAPSQRLKITNPSGHQVVDLWAFPMCDRPPSWMSMAQTRSKLMKLIPSINDSLIDTRRDPVLTLVEDSSPMGIHDMLFPPCDEWRYRGAGMPEHDSCGANLRRELAKYLSAQSTNNSSHDVGSDPLAELESSIRRWGWTPEPFNLFMNVPWSGGQGELSVKKPECRPNDFVTLEVRTECLVVMSACPNDLMDTNGGQPGAATYEVLT